MQRGQWMAGVVCGWMLGVLLCGTGVYGEPPLTNSLGRYQPLEGAFDGFIGITNGYFYDQVSGEPFVPHGIAYQTWNRPLGVWQTYDQVDYDLDEMVKMGANSVRIDMVWQHIEGDGARTVAEGDNHFAFEKWDYFVRACEKRKLRIFPLIGYQWPPNWFPNEWYTKHPPATDSEGIYHDERWSSDIINCVIKQPLFLG